MKRTYLYIAHPGHELLLSQWIIDNKPEVNILTDGSGAAGVSRLGSSTRVLERLGANKGLIFGKFTDAEIYAHILNRNINIFSLLVDNMLNAWRQNPPSCIVVDGLEGYNPAHDLINLLVSCACRYFAEQEDKNISLYSFNLVNKAIPAAGSIITNLTDEQRKQKKELAFSYPEMRKEVDMAIARLGEEECLTECLDVLNYNNGYESTEGTLPFYELYGEKKVQEGVYENVLRQKDLEEIWNAITSMDK